MLALDAGADDFNDEDEDAFEILTNPDDCGTVREALEKEYEKSEAQGDNYYQRIIDRRIDAIPSSEISSNLECKQNPGY